MENWHARTTDETLEAFGVRVQRGLSTEEAEKRWRKHGANRLREVETAPWWRVLLSQFKSILVYLLAAAAVLAFATQRLSEAVAVVAVIVVNTLIGFMSEWRAMRSMAALRKMGEHTTRVRRDEQEQEIAASQLVPGDVVLLRAGDLVPADLRLVQGEHLRVNEAPLTGESVPVDKVAEPVDEGTDLAGRRDMLFKATTIADGTAVGIAVATGTETELGRIAQLAEEAESTVTPLQKRLDALGRRLAWLTIGIAIAVAALGIFVRQQETTLIVETALALGIAAIPEGLPIVATIALARGMYLMAKRNALVNQLTAVETLGATRVIFTDKTGTLTENEMRLQKVVTPSGELSLDDDEHEGKPDRGDPRWRAVQIGLLCNAASLQEAPDEDNPRGDPTEVALLLGGRTLGLERDELLEESPEARVEKFDPRVKKMATFHEQRDQVYVAVKGAPQAVLDVCTHIASDSGDQRLGDEGQRKWITRSDELADTGLRVLAAADKKVDSIDVEPYEGLCFVGLLGLLDPPREEVKAAIDTCQAAGVRVEMVTGDQPGTAKAIARAVGIIGEADDPEAVVMHGRELEDLDVADDEQRSRIYRANIFARVSPEQKLKLVRAYQESGEIVAMTGDGINDAPALKKADIGVAMGKRGTEAAKQVADMVLKDDAFTTVVAAVHQGRIIFANIRRSVMFMLCTNVAEVLVVTLATVADWTLPIRPLQILFLNVLTDVFPALALGVGPGSGHEMDHPPRDPNESVLERRHWVETAGWAALLASCVLLSLKVAQHGLGLTEPEAVTVSFLTLAFGKLWFTFNLRRPESGLLRNEISTNPWLWAAIAFCSVLLLGAVYLPGLNQLLDTRELSWQAWALLLGMSFIPLPVGQAVREIQHHVRKRRRPASQLIPSTR